MLEMISGRGLSAALAGPASRRPTPRRPRRDRPAAGRCPARRIFRPLAWAAIATANLSAMTLFLWHQTAFLAVTMSGLLARKLPGLHTAPTSALWVAERLAWLPAFAVALGLLWLVFRRAERPPRSGTARLAEPVSGRSCCAP